MSPALDPVAICVAPNGARRTKHDHPMLPTTPEELARDAGRCLDAGATVLHLHVRDEAGAHSLDAGRYREALHEVRNRVGDRMLLQITTEAVGRYSPTEQAALVMELLPEAASVSVAEMHAGDASVAAAFYRDAPAAGVAIQHILYSGGDVARLLDLVSTGVIEDSPNALFVLGRYVSGQTASVDELAAFLANWPSHWPWSVCAFGAREPQCAAAAIGLGGHVRIGFENNLLAADGSVANDNSVNVANAAALATHSGRGLATIAQARLIYGAELAVTASTAHANEDSAWQS